ILKILVIVLCPEIVAAHRVRQLGGNPNPVAKLPDAARHHIPDAQLPADLADIDGSPLVESRRTMRDYEQLMEATQSGNDVVGNPLRKIVLSGLVAEIGERKDDDWRFLG